jgi:hypothetical protein
VSRIARVAGLAGTVVAAWLLAAPVAFVLNGLPGVAYSLVAAVLCGIPGVLTLAVLLAASSPEARVLAVIGGSLVRLLAALGGGLLLGLAWPVLLGEGLHFFWGWVLVFYWFTLAAEVGWAYLPH